MWTVNFQMFKLVLKKAEEPETKLPISAVSSKKQEFQKNIYFCFIDYAKAFNCVGHNKLWKIMKEMGIPDHLICLLRNLYAGHQSLWLCGSQKTGKLWKRWEYQTTLLASWGIYMQVKNQQLEPDMEQQTGSKLGKEYIKAINCHSAYLTYMQNTSCEMPGCMKH